MAIVFVSPPRIIRIHRPDSAARRLLDPDGNVVEIEQK